MQGVSTVFLSATTSIVVLGALQGSVQALTQIRASTRSCSRQVPRKQRPLEHFRATPGCPMTRAGPAVQPFTERAQKQYKDTVRFLTNSCFVQRQLTKVPEVAEQEGCCRSDRLLMHEFLGWEHCWRCFEKGGNCVAAAECTCPG